jgi:hypothetical protein
MAAHGEDPEPNHHRLVRRQLQTYRNGVSKGARPAGALAVRWQCYRSRRVNGLLIQSLKASRVEHGGVELQHKVKLAKHKVKMMDQKGKDQNTQKRSASLASGNIVQIYHRFSCLPLWDLRDLES